MSRYIFRGFNGFLIFRIPKSNGEVNGEIGQAGSILNAIEGKMPYMLRLGYFVILILHLLAASFFIFF